MGSADQDASKRDLSAETNQQTQSASVPPLISPPKRPVRLVAAPEPAPVAPKPAAKSPAAQPSPAPAVADSPPDPGAYRYQPIAPPSEPMQYRAIGLVRGTYEPSEADQLNRGNLITADGQVIDAVLLGRITSLVKKHIDLTLPHLWVVYPRTRREMEADGDDLHLQIVGVWEPETLGLPGETPAREAATDGEADDQTEAGSTAAIAPEREKPNLADLPPVDDNFFSIRGEVVKYDPDDHCITVKILQVAKRTPGTAKPFKLSVQGAIEGRTVGYFWDFKVRREAKTLVMAEATVVGIVPPKKRPKGSGSRQGKPGPRRGGAGRPPMPSRKPAGTSGSDRPKKRIDTPSSSAE